MEPSELGCPDPGAISLEMLQLRIAELEKRFALSAAHAESSSLIGRPASIGSGAVLPNHGGKIPLERYE